MRHTTRWLLILALAVTAAFSLPVPSRANRAPVAPASVVTDTHGPQDHWWGGAAAIACGLGMRGWPAFGWNLGYNAFLVVACVTVLIDSLS